jgi:hypothetical protein
MTGDLHEMRAKLDPEDYEPPAAEDVPCDEALATAAMITQS